MGQRIGWNRQSCLLFPDEIEYCLMIMQMTVVIVIHQNRLEVSIYTHDSISRRTDNSKPEEITQVQRHVA